MSEFEKLVAERGEPQQRVVVSSQDAERYRGRVPDALIAFWLKHGRGSYGDGKEWICDPKVFEPVVEAVFGSDPDFKPADLVVIQREAFPSLTMWSSRLEGPVTVGFNTGNVQAHGKDSWINKQTGLRESADFIIGALFYRAKFVEAWVDDNDEDMLPDAIKRCGALQVDEVYGFFPALQLGGANRASNLRRVKAVEHMLFLAEITEFKLISTKFPNPADPTGYTQIVERRIGKR